MNLGFTPPLSLSAVRLTPATLFAYPLVVFLLQAPVSLCSLGVGATFGESILHDLPRESTVVTQANCELLRVEQRDFRMIWEVSDCLSTSLLPSKQCLT